MTVSELKNKVLSGEFDAKFAAECGIGADRADANRARVAAAIDAFAEIYGADRDGVELFSVGGRSEISGNHTDHNHGRVIAASINLDIIAVAAKRDDGVIRVKSEGFPEDVVPAECAEAPDESKFFTSASIIAGMERAFLDAGYAVGGYDAYTTSNVLKGSGLSSSAAFEVMIGNILSHMYNGGKVDNVEIAKMAQFAENKFFGKPCGLMDQSAIALGGVNLIDFADFENPVVEKAHWAFSDLDIYVIATGGDHSDLTDDYAAIPHEMKEVANCFGAKLLHEISPEKWNRDKQNIVGKVSERAYLRAEHFFEENARVENAVKAIDDKDEKAFLDIVNESGLSSRYKLQNTYSPAGKNHNLENALDRVVKIDGVVASRVHGGGFAGTILVFADKKESGVESALNVMFGDENVFKLAIRQSGATKLDLEK